MTTVQQPDVTPAERRHPESAEALSIEISEECRPCYGTGLYVGRFEGNGAAIVCRLCNGTGEIRFHHEYIPFRRRHPQKGIKRVYRANPGFFIGEIRDRVGGHSVKLGDFGGMPHEEWERGDDFQTGSEMRGFACPLWWSLATNEKKPDWRECPLVGCNVKDCQHYPEKGKCWEKWDREQGERR